jgi:hypothetical protein
MSTGEYGFTAVAPEPAKTDYFQTQLAGLIIKVKQQEIKYILDLKIVKPFPTKSFAEISFENPDNPQMPFVVTSIINPEDSTLLVYSPPVQRPQKGKYYKIDVRVFKDLSKKEIITKHTQTILSLINQESIAVWSSLKGMKKWSDNKYRLEVDYPGKWFVKEIKNGNTFQVFFSLEDIDRSKYYSTGVMIVKQIDPMLQKGGMPVNHKIIDETLSVMKKVISESREEIMTERGYEGVLAKIHFVNYKGEEEKEWMAVFSHERKLVMMICEAPRDTFEQYDKIFYSIISTAQLY